MLELLSLRALSHSRRRMQPNANINDVKNVDYRTLACLLGWESASLTDILIMTNAGRARPVDRARGSVALLNATAVCNAECKRRDSLTRPVFADSRQKS